MDNDTKREFYVEPAELERILTCALENENKNQLRMELGV